MTHTDTNTYTCVHVHIHVFPMDINVFVTIVMNSFKYYGIYSGLGLLYIFSTNKHWDTCLQTFLTTINNEVSTVIKVRLVSEVTCRSIVD
jgi:hypothetical protein